MIKSNYRATVFASCIGYIVQAIVCNFAPLLFLTFEESYGIPLVQLTALITVNFFIQLLTDIGASRFVPVIGYRKCVLLAHILSAAGLILLAVLPTVMPPFWGLLIAICIFAVGGGLIEVVISPIVESCPTKNKAGFMSLLHSFYCWGVVISVGLSTLFFVLCGTERWQILSCLLAVLPLLNFILFLFVPIYPVEGDTAGERAHFSGLFRHKLFLLMLLLMLCAGASEIAVGQWASAFAESALGVSKTLGDLVGVCGFALMMALARTVYAKIDTRLPLKTALTACSLLCIAAYLLIGLSDNAVLGLIGVAMCGLAVGIFWPATFSLAVSRIPKGGTALFGFLAFAGDLGCSLGPTVAGLVSGAHGDDLRLGILSVIVFPILLLLGLFTLHIIDRNTKQKKS